MDVVHALELSRQIISAVPALRTHHIHSDTFFNDGGRGSLGKLQIARGMLRGLNY